MRFRVWLVFAMGLVCAQAHAQDFHFSQFYVSPMLQNPANAGFFNCSYRFTGIYRNQWRSVGVPYKTFAGSLDMRFIGKRGNKDIGGVGAVFFSDKAGDPDMSHSGAMVAGAYHKNIDKDRAGVNYLGGGAMLGFAGGSLDYMKLRFSDQYLSPGNVSLVSMEPGVSSFNYIDMSAGIEYNWIPESKNNHVQVGVAMFHINRPDKTFRNDGTSELPRKLVAHASGQARLNAHLELFPKLQLARQAKRMETQFGSLVRLDLDKMKNDYYGVYLGAFGRIVGDHSNAAAADAVILMTRLDVKELSLAFSYDVNLSLLRYASESRGGPEFSIIYIGCLARGNPKGVYCPRF